MNIDIAFVNLLDVMNLYTKSKPLGLLSLTNQLEKAGYIAKVFDFNYIYRNEENGLDLSNNTLINSYNMANYIMTFAPRIVSIYTMCNNLNDAIQLSEVFKAIDDSIITILSGPQGTMLAEEILNKVPSVDLIGYGEGEDTIVDIVGTLVNQGAYDLEGVEGIAYRNPEGEVFINVHNSIVDLDTLLPLKFEMIDSVENIRKSPIEMEIGRGCPFSCKYCSTSIFWGRKFRVKSVAKVISEIKFYIAKYKTNSFLFHHDLLTFRKDYILELCNEILNQRLSISWGCYSRLDVIDEEMISIMAKAGCKTIYFGIETGSSKIQKIIGKNLELDKINRILPVLIENNISSEYSFIIGFPEETEEDIDMTLEFATNLRKIQVVHGQEKYNLAVDIFQLQFYPKTEMTRKYYDQLECSEYAIEPRIHNPYYPIMNSDIYISRIRENKDLFVNFYNTETNLDEKNIQLPRFCMCILNSLFNYAPNRFFDCITKGCKIFELYNYLWDVDKEYVFQIIKELIFNPNQGGDREKEILEELMIRVEMFVKRKMC